MRPLELILPGRFYDSQLYTGKLYLWTLDGALQVVDWDRLIEAIETPQRLKLALECAFRRSEYLYAPQFEVIFRDEEVRQVVVKKFDDLAAAPIQITEQQLERCTLAKQDNPFSFPHADSTIYSGVIFVGSRSGVSIARCYEFEIEELPDRLTDIPALGLAAGASRLAVAAGTEGVFQSEIYPRVTKSFDQVLKHHSTLVRWLQISLFATSQAEGGYFADFVTKRRRRGEDKTSPKQRVLRDVFQASEIFGHKPELRNTFVWGAEDKVCLVTNAGIEVVRFDSRRRREERFERLGTVPTNYEVKGEIVSGDSSVFGFVVEYEGGLFVLDSSMNTEWLPGEPVNWRTFARSRYYTNQLHIVRHDHLAVLSFNHDYFINQKLKRVGVEWRPPFRRATSEAWSATIAPIADEFRRGTRLEDDDLDF